jgi:CBS domain-containing protein
MMRGVAMTVRDLIGGEVVATRPASTMREAIGLMADRDVGALVVEDDGALVGILTERDVVRACAHGAKLDWMPVDMWMTRDPDSLEPDIDIDEAAQWMLAAGYRHLPVVDGTDLVGVVSIKDVLWALTDRSAV